MSILSGLSAIYQAGLHPAQFYNFMFDNAFKFTTNEVANYSGSGSNTNSELLGAQTIPTMSFSSKALIVGGIVGYFLLKNKRGL